MNQPQFRFISLQENLLEIVVDEIPAQDALLIFPTEMSCKAAMRIFQKKSELQNIAFLSIEKIVDVLG